MFPQDFIARFFFFFYVVFIELLFDFRVMQSMSCYMKYLSQTASNKNIVGLKKHITISKAVIYSERYTFVVT